MGIFCIDWEMNPTFGCIKDKTVKEMWEFQEFEQWRGQRIETTCKDCCGLGGIGQEIEGTMRYYYVKMKRWVRSLK